jgi:hypothetical protein
MTPESGARTLSVGCELGFTVVDRMDLALAGDAELTTQFVTAVVAGDLPADDHTAPVMLA